LCKNHFSVAEYCPVDSRSWAFGQDAPRNFHAEGYTIAQLEYAGNRAMLQSLTCGLLGLLGWGLG